MENNLKEIEVECYECLGRGWFTDFEGKQICGQCEGTGTLTDEVPEDLDMTGGE